MGRTTTSKTLVTVLPKGQFNCNVVAHLCKNTLMFLTVKSMHDTWWLKYEYSFSGLTSSSLITPDKNENPILNVDGSFVQYFKTLRMWSDFNVSVQQVMSHFSTGLTSPRLTCVCTVNASVYLRFSAPTFMISGINWHHIMVFI